VQAQSNPVIYADALLVAFGRTDHADEADEVTALLGALFVVETALMFRKSLTSG
jgi:hypothetical protein